MKLLSFLWRSASETSSCIKHKCIHYSGRRFFALWPNFKLLPPDQNAPDFHTMLPTFVLPIPPYGTKIGRVERPHFHSLAAALSPLISPCFLKVKVTRHLDCHVTAMDQSGALTLGNLRPFPEDYREEDIFFLFFFAQRKHPNVPKTAENIVPLFQNV